MDGKGNTGSLHESTNAREARIQTRRQRVAEKAARENERLATANGKRGSNNNGSESSQLRQGQQQVAESLGSLDHSKSTSIEKVTDVRVAADGAEYSRRLEEEDRRHRRVQRIQQEATTSGTSNAAIEMRWSELFALNMPQELHDELEVQQKACEDILASKDSVIREFQLQLKSKDEEYVNALKRQSEDIEQLVSRMNDQYREMEESYERELNQIEDAFMKERDELLASNKSEIDALFDRRREMELEAMENKQKREEQYVQDIEELRVKGHEKYSDLKIKLETNIQTLEQQLEEMRATYQLNTEKLEYNYRVLTERDMENSATLAQQKRKLARLKDTLNALLSRYNQTEARDQQKNQELTEDFRRVTKQYRDLQKKYRHFETKDREQYGEVWAMHEEEISEKLDKLLKADRVVHEQFLGLTWVPPAKSIQQWKDHRTDGRFPTSNQKDNMDGSTNIEGIDRVKPNMGEGQENSARSDGFGMDEEEEDQVVRKISSAKLKYMLRMIASEAGFLVSSNIQKALEDLPNDEAALVKADAIMKTLGVENESDINQLMKLFFQDPHADDEIHGANAASEQDEDETIHWQQKEMAAKYGLLIQPENVIRVIKQFVEDLNEMKRTMSMGRLLRKASRNSITDATTSTSKGNNAPGMKIPEEEKEVEKKFWKATQSVIPERTHRVMRTLERALESYHQALRQRKDKLDEVEALQSQNMQLKELLKQYLSAPVNDDLLIPPTQLQMYQQ